jgi:hypothetical protein
VGVGGGSIDFSVSDFFVKLNIGLCVSVYVSLSCNLLYLSLYIRKRSHVFITWHSLHNI